MKKGYLSSYFEALAVKKLSAVEVDSSRSNQHEFNGSNSLRRLFGSEDRRNIPAKFVWLGGEEGRTEESTISWYDARRKHPTRSEYRLYFQKNPVMDLAKAGDLLIVARRPDGEIWLFVIKSESTYQNQVLWLFGLDTVGEKFEFHDVAETDSKICFVSRFVLENMGIEPEEHESVDLESILQPFLGKRFPSSTQFSELARQSLGESCSPLEDPDNTLLEWMEHEERLFKYLERTIVSKRLEEGFFDPEGIPDVDEFIKFSLSVLNRRKSRVGRALENHLEELFRLHRVSYSKGQITENRSRPDFIFPGIQQYHDPFFPPHRLTMLGVKSTCKDRWRQVLAEASRIGQKHLLTLEPGISEHQTNEMKANNLQLVLPRPVHETYKPGQVEWLMDVKTFLELVKKRELDM